jgi:hypothetical protein
VARRRQGELVPDPLHQFVGPGQHRQFEGEIDSAARHRPVHRKIAAHRDRRRLRRPGTALRHQIEGRLVGEDATEMRRRAQRAADIGAELQGHEAGGECRRRAARRSARGAAEIPRIIGGAVNVVVALPIPDRDRQIGLADHDSAGGLEPLHRPRVDFCLPVLEFRIAPGRRQAGDAELLLDRHRQSEQRAAVTPRQSGVGVIGRLSRPVEIAHHNGVDLRVERLDAGDGGVEQLAGGNLPVGKGLRQFASGAIGRLIAREGAARRHGGRRDCRPDPGHNRTAAW